MHRVADLETLEVDHQGLGDGINAAIQLDRMTNDIDDTAAAQARRPLLVDKAHRHINIDACARDELQEIDMQRHIADRMGLHLARQHAQCLTVERQRIVPAEKPAAPIFGIEVVERQRYRHRLHARAIDDTRHSALAAQRPRAAFAARGARFGA